MLLKTHLTVQVRDLLVMRKGCLSHGTQFELHIQSLISVSEKERDSDPEGERLSSKDTRSGLGQRN